MGERGEHAVVAELVVRGQREAAVLVVRLDGVGFDGVEALLPAHVEAGRHQRLQLVELADVEPLLALPAVARALEGLGEGGGVGAEVLPGTGVDVADHLAALGVQRGDHGGVGLEAVDVVDRDVDGLVHAAAELPLPGEAGGGLPAGTGRGGRRTGSARGAGDGRSAGGTGSGRGAGRGGAARGAGSAGSARDGRRARGAGRDRRGAGGRRRRGARVGGGGRGVRGAGSARDGGGGGRRGLRAGGVGRGVVLVLRTRTAARGRQQGDGGGEGEGGGQGPGAAGHGARTPSGVRWVR